VSDADYVRTLPVGVRHVGDNLAVPALDPRAVRMRRHILLAGCQDLVYPFWREAIDRDSGEISKKSEFRVSVCCRNPVDDKVRIYQNDEAVGYSGLMRCGNVWGCPICCAKVMRRRASQIANLFEAVHKGGGSAVMVTFTASHQLWDKLMHTLEAFKAAKRTLTQSRPYRDLALGRSGTVSATEITYSPKNGWHPHQHDVWFFDRLAPDCDYLADKLFEAWSVAAEKNGLSTQASYRGRRIGVDVRPSWDASEYLAKFDRERDWSLSSEMTAGRLNPPNYKKVGRSRKKIVSYSLAPISPLMQQHFDAIELAKTQVITSTAIDVRPSMKIRWYRWCKGVHLCVPFEVRGRDDLKQLVALTRKLLARETTLQKEFGDYVYSNSDWLKDHPAV